MKRCPQCGKQYATQANFCPIDAGRLEDVPDNAPVDVDEQVLGGRFAMGEHLGDGGKTGQVFDATDEQSGERCVVKWVDRDVFASPLQMQRTEREFKQLERATAPGIAKILGHGRKGERMWFASEYFEGVSLRDLVAEHGPLGHERAAGLVHAIGNALSEAAKLGVIHRDVAPKNVLVGEGDAIKVINFGVAVPTTPSVRGVPEYVAPEQVDGKPVDQRSNIYSLGAIYFFLVTGRPPFEGDVQSVHSAHLHSPPPKASEHAEVPAEVDKLIDRALAKQSSKRYMTLRQLLGELARISGNEPSLTARLVASANKPRPKNSAAQTMLGVGALSHAGDKPSLADLAPPVEGRTARRPTQEVDEEAETHKISVTSADASATSGEIEEVLGDDRPAPIAGEIGSTEPADADADDADADEGAGDDDESSRSSNKKKKRRRRRKRRKTRKANDATAARGDDDSVDGADDDDRASDDNDDDRAIDDDDDDDDDRDDDDRDGDDRDGDDRDDDDRAIDHEDDERDEVAARRESRSAARGSRAGATASVPERPPAVETTGNRTLLIAGVIAAVAIIAIIALVVS